MHHIIFLFFCFVYCSHICMFLFLFFCLLLFVLFVWLFALCQRRCLARFVFVCSPEHWLCSQLSNFHGLFLLQKIVALRVQSTPSTYTVCHRPTYLNANKHSQNAHQFSQHIREILRHTLRKRHNTTHRTSSNMCTFAVVWTRNVAFGPSVCVCNLRAACISSSSSRRDSQIVILLRLYIVCAYVFVHVLYIIGLFILLIIYHNVIFLVVVCLCLCVWSACLRIV